jgi:glycosyltransferase involved in cell wall biosynthesis
MQQRVSGPSIPEPERLVGDRKLELRIHRPPRDSGYGRVRKAAFEYALRRGLDHVVFMRGDGLHPPEALCSLVHSAVMGAPRLVIASRMVRRRETLRAGMPLARLAAHSLATGFQNRVLGLRLTDYHSGFRLYPVRDVERVPFQLNADDRGFDMQIMIQFRALGAAIDEVPVLPVWQEYATALRWTTGCTSFT